MKNEPSFAELSATFRYTDDGKLWRLVAETETNRKWKRFAGQWIEIDMSKANSGDGYICVSFNGKPAKAHRIIYSLFHKMDIPADMQIDHTNGNKIDNHICNLELVTNRGNAQNLQRHRNGHLCGTSWHKQRNKWRSQIQVNGKNKHLGYFNTEIEAHQAYLDALGKLEFNQTIDSNEFWGDLS